MSKKEKIKPFRRSEKFQQKNIRRIGIQLNFEDLVRDTFDIEDQLYPPPDNSLIGFVVISDRCVESCNRTFAQLFGFENEKQIINKNIREIFSASDCERIVRFIKKLDESSGNLHGEFSAYKKNNDEIFLEVTGSRIFFNGKPALQAAIRDITEQKRAQIALQQSEKKFRYLFEGSPDAIYVLNANGIIIDANLAASLLHEMGRSELLEMPFLALVADDMKETIQKEFNSLLSGEINFYETYVVTDSGLNIPVEIRSRQVNFGDEPHTMFYVRDISDRVSVGKSFVESQRALSNFMSNLPGMAYRCLNDEKYTMKFVSNGSIAITGFKPEDFIENKAVAYRDLIEPQFRKYVQEQVQNSVIKRNPYRMEYQISTASGERKWVWEQGRGVFDEKGRLLALEGIIIDITQQKEAEIALRESEKRFRSLIENVPSISVIGYDSSHRIFFWNKASEQFFGFSAGEVCNKKLEDVIFPVEKRDEMKLLIDDWIKNDKAILPGETVFTRKDGSTFFAHSSHAMLRNSQNEKELYCLNVDLTELHQTKQDLQRSLQNFKEALDGTIRALTIAVETRDPYTAGHQVGVAKLACAIARELNFSDDQIEGLRVGCLLHDIGNLNVPAEILNKPGQLTEIEYTLLKTHPQFGHEILRRINFPWPVAKMVLQHHERLDGSGYPNGINGDEIMLEAKIIAVADVVEPISSHRPYRPALGIEKAIEEIEKGKGRLYDEEIVDICVRLIREKGFRFDNNHQEE